MSTRIPRIAVIGLFTALLLGASTQSFATSANDKALALTMAKTAKDALLGGKYGLAAQMFVEAMKMDPSQADYLYGLARALDLSGKKRLAEQRYRQFLKQTKGHRAEAKVRRFLATLLVKRAAHAQDKRDGAEALRLLDEASQIDPGRSMWPKRVAAIADSAFAASDYNLALQACAVLRRLEPNKPAHLLRQARIYRAKGDLSAAQRDFLQVMTSAPQSPSGVAAKRELAALITQKQRSPEATPAQPPIAARRAPAVTPRRSVSPVKTAKTPHPSKVKSAPMQVAARQEPPGSWHRPAGWAATIVGVLTVAAGGVVLGSAKVSYDDLIGRLGHTNGNGLVDTMSREAAQRELDGINNRKPVGAALLGVGGVVAGLGVWWLASAPASDESTVVLLPHGRGLALRVGW